MNSVSIAEARQISDVLVVVGDDSLTQSYPRLPILLRSSHRVRDSEPTVLLLGSFSLETMRQWRAVGFDVWSVPCEVSHVPQALAQWSNQQSKTNSQVSVAMESKLLRVLSESRYTSVIWSSALLQVSEPDLWVERMLDFIRTRNETVRTSALMLSSLDGTFQQTCTWLTGFPGRIRFRDSIPQYDPDQNRYERWIHNCTSDNGPSVVIVLDETVGYAPFELVLSEEELTRRNVVRWDLSTRSVETPVAVAGHEFPCDLFRADLVVQARSVPNHSSQDFKIETAASWLLGIRI